MKYGVYVFFVSFIVMGSDYYSSNPPPAARKNAAKIITLCVLLYQAEHQVTEVSHVGLAPASQSTSPILSFAHTRQWLYITTIYMYVGIKYFLCPFARSPGGAFNFLASLLGQSTRPPCRYTCVCHMRLPLSSRTYVTARSKQQRARAAAGAAGSGAPALLL